MLELVRYSDDSREVVMSNEQFIELDKSAYSLEGQGLAQLSQTDPHSTYRLLRKQLEAVVNDDSVRSVEVNGSLLVDDSTGTRRDMAAIALSLIRELPNGDGSSFVFKLKVEASEEDIELFGSTEPIEVLEILVEAQNFAA